MDEDEGARAGQRLFTTFQRDQEEAPKRRRWWQRPLEGRRGAWLLALGVIVFVLAWPAFIVIYPRFGPVDTMTAFCTDEATGDYAAAYGLLSKRVQARVSLDAFTQASQSAELSGCSPANGIPLILGQPTARLDFNYSTKSSESGNGIGPMQTAQIPQTVGTMNFVREQGGWRIDGMNPDFFHLSS